MKCKLIQFNEFVNKKTNSLSESISELVEAEDLIAGALGLPQLSVVSFDNEEVLFETFDGSYLRANFSIDENKIILENVEKLVIDQKSEKQKAEEILLQVVEAVEEDNFDKANRLMSDYIELDINRARRERYDESLTESEVRLYGTRGKGGKPKIFARSGSKNPAKSIAAKKGWKRWRSNYIHGARKRTSHLPEERARRKQYKKYYNLLNAKSSGKQYTGKRKRNLKEWSILAENVFERINVLSGNSVFIETKVFESDSGLTVHVPTKKRRHNLKLLTIANDGVKTDLKVWREGALKLHRNKEFADLVSNARRSDAISEDVEFQNAIEKIATKFPSAIYLTNEELASIVNKVVESTGVRNFPTSSCELIVDGIRRTIYENYQDRANKLLKVVNKKSETIEEFDENIESAFNLIDEEIQVERNMVKDLYQAVVSVKEMAEEVGNSYLASESDSYAYDLRNVLNGRESLSQELVSEVAEWLDMIAETNLEGDHGDGVVKTPYTTENGDNPMVFKHASKGYTPSKDFSQDFPPGGLASDGHDYKSGKYQDEMLHKGFGNKGGNKVYPDLDNDYLPEPHEFDVNDDDHVDQDGLSVWQSDDTYPRSTNPYLPKADILRQTVDPTNRVD